MLSLSTPYWSYKPPRGLIHSLFASPLDRTVSSIFPLPPPLQRRWQTHLSHAVYSTPCSKFFSPITYLRQGIEWLSSECELFIIHTLIVFLFLFLFFSFFSLFYYYFFFRILIFFVIGDVPRCSGMFHVPDFIDGRNKVLGITLTAGKTFFFYSETNGQYTLNEPDGKLSADENP